MISSRLAELISGAVRDMRFALSPSPGSGEVSPGPVVERKWDRGLLGWLRCGRDAGNAAVAFAEKNLG